MHIILITMPEAKPSIFSKLIAINSKPTKETFPELPNIIIWFRCILAITYGVFLGMSDTHRSGGANVIFGLNFITFVPVLYCSTYLGADQQSYDNKILFAGVINSVALMLLIWIYFYTANHESDAAALASMLSNAIGASSAGEDPIADGGMAAEETPPVVEEAEF